MRQPEEVKKIVNDVANSFPENSKFENFGMKGAIVGALDKALGSTEKRYEVLGWLFNDNKPMSSKELHGRQWIGLVHWLKIAKIEDMWLPQSDFQDEAIIIQIIAEGERIMNETA